MTGVAGATGLVNRADVTGATGDVKLIGVDVGSEILRGCGMETGVDLAAGVGLERLSGLETGAGAEKLSGVVTGAGAEISNGAEIWMREVVGRDFGTEVAWVLEVGRMVALFLSDSRSESKEMVTFFVVAVGAGVTYEAGAGVRMSETAENSSEKTILRGALTKWRLRVPEFLTVI